MASIRSKKCTRNVTIIIIIIIITIIINSRMVLDWFVKLVMNFCPHITY